MILQYSLQQLRLDVIADRRQHLHIDTLRPKFRITVFPLLFFDEWGLAVRAYLSSIEKLRAAIGTLHRHSTYLPFRATFGIQAAILFIHYTIKSLYIKTVYICLRIV